LALRSAPGVCERPEQAIDGRDAPDCLRNSAARLRVRIARHFLRDDRIVLPSAFRVSGGRFPDDRDDACPDAEAHEARTKDHRRTEMWLYLPKDRRPPQAYAQQTISALMREIYLQFAQWTALISIVMLTIALLFSLVDG
jgi:hypothetical protein